LASIAIWLAGLGVLALLAVVLMLSVLQQGKRITALTAEVKELSQTCNDLSAQLDPSQGQKLDDNNNLLRQLIAQGRQAQPEAGGGQPQPFVPQFIPPTEEKLPPLPANGHNEIGVVEAPPQGQHG